jgi:CheY-like chemotaxis protein
MTRTNELAVCRCILLVEDNEINREIAAEQLEDEGYQVIPAENGAAALEIVRQARHGQLGAILMDVQMPVMDGYEATRAIRSLADPALASIPIIALTAYSDDKNQKTALDAGMNAYLSKPLYVDKLTDVLAAV